MIVKALFLAASYLALAPGVAGGQTGLRLTRADTIGGQIAYSYEVKMGPKDTGSIAEISIDISAPKAKQTPVMLGVRGRFMFDALKSRYNAVLLGHAPLFMGIPNGWFGFINTEGEAMWWVEEDKSSLRPGSGQGGLILKSPALPGLRRFSLKPSTPLPDADHPTPARAVRSWSGYVLGPGWMASDVNARYLQYQVDVGCRLKMAEARTCQEYRTWGLALIQSENTRDDQVYLGILRSFRAKMAQDKAMDPVARMIWGRAAEALASRPPSRRINPNNL